MGIRLGADAILYYRSSGSWASPVYSQITDIKDLSADMSMEEADVTARASGKLRHVEPIMLLDGLEWEMIEINDAVDFLFIQAAFDARTLIELFCCSGDKTGSGETFVRFEGKVLSFKKKEPLTAVNTYSVTAKPAFSTNSPTFGITGGGTMNLSKSTVTVAKAAPSTLNIVIQRTGGDQVAAGVHYATANGTVTAGTDYTSTSGTIVWLVNEVSRVIPVPILGAGNAGTFTFTLSSATGTGSALGTPIVETVTLA